MVEDVLEKLVCSGDLKALSPEQRVAWYKMRCESVGLDPRTQPFSYILLNGKLTLYATRTATEQLAQIRRISIGVTDRSHSSGLYVVTCRAIEPDGRYTDSIGAVSVEGLKGEALCNALMKAETKAKRRAVLSLTGCGMLSEEELDTIPDAKQVAVNVKTGEMSDAHIASSPVPPQISADAVKQALLSAGLPANYGTLSNMLGREIKSIGDITQEERKTLIADAKAIAETANAPQTSAPEEDPLTAEFKEIVKNG